MFLTMTHRDFFSEKKIWVSDMVKSEISTDKRFLNEVSVRKP